MNNLMPNVHFSKDQIIFEEGYPADAVYLVCSGSVEIFKRRNNSQLSLAILKEDSIFGEMAFISDRPRSATVIAREDTWCYSLSKNSFLQRLQNTDPIIVNVFHDLVDTIREKSNNAVVIDHGKIEPMDELEQMELRTLHSLEEITPQHSKEYVTKDKSLKEKVEKMDLFMRLLYKSLVAIAYK